MEKVAIQRYVPDLPLDKVDVAEENVRKTNQKSGLEELQHSIQEFGLIHPIVVIAEGGRYKVIVGQRRYLAFKELGNTTIPALVIDSLDATSQKIVSLGENLHRTELPYDDTIKVCEALFSQYSGTKSEKVKKIARDLGVSPGTVSQYLANRLVPPQVRALVDEGKLSRKLAYRITSSFWPNEQKIIDIAKRTTRLTKSESERALDVGIKKPKASVEEIITEAKTPKPIYELVIHLDPETGKRLDEMADKRRTDATNLVIDLIQSMLKREGMK